MGLEEWKRKGTENALDRRNGPACVILLYSVQLGGQRSPLSTTGNCGPSTQLNKVSLERPARGGGKRWGEKGSGGKAGAVRDGGSGENPKTLRENRVEQGNLIRTSWDLKSLINSSSLSLTHSTPPPTFSPCVSPSSSVSWLAVLSLLPVPSARPT